LIINLLAMMVSAGTHVVS